MHMIWFIDFYDHRTRTLQCVTLYESFNSVVHGFLDGTETVQVTPVVTLASSS